MSVISASSFARNRRLSAYFDRWLLQKDIDPIGYILYARTAKLIEECGEVMEAVIGYLGDNPRKGKHKTALDVQTELCDVIVTAMCALSTITPTNTEMAHMINERFRFIETRLATREDYNAPA